MTVINNPPAQGEGSGGMGFLLGVILLIVFIVALLYFVVPLINQNQGPQINVPGQIDVNLKGQ